MPVWATVTALLSALAWATSFMTLVVASVKRKLCGAGRTLLLLAGAVTGLSGFCLGVATSISIKNPWLFFVLFGGQFALFMSWMNLLRHWAMHRIIKRHRIYIRAQAIDDAARYEDGLRRFAQANGLPLELARRIAETGASGVIIITNNRRTDNNTIDGSTTDET
jgi:hypothetical protein